MLTSLLASAATEAEAAANPLVGVSSKFGIEPFYLLSQVLSFAILGYVLYRWGLKPVLATMDERNAKIDEGLKHSVEMKARLAAAQAEAAEQLKKASVEANKIVNEARSIAKDIEARAQADAQKRTEDLISKATQAIELDRQKVMAEARAEITRLVVVTTEKVLRKELTDSERSRYNASAATELASV